MHDEHADLHADRGNADKIFHRVVRKLWIHDRIDRMTAGDDVQRVAVFRTLADQFGGDHAIRAGAVVDDDRLAQHFRELEREKP